MLRTCQCLPDKQEVVQAQEKGEQDKQAVVVVSNTTEKPCAVVVKPVAAAIAQLAVFRSLRNHNLEREGRDMREEREKEEWEDRERIEKRGGKKEGAEGR